MSIEIVIEQYKIYKTDNPDKILLLRKKIFPYYWIFFTNLIFFNNGWIKYEFSLEKLL
jgi:hypothetical protein